MDGINQGFETRRVEEGNGVLVHYKELKTFPSLIASHHTLSLITHTIYSSYRHF